MQRTGVQSNILQNKETALLYPLALIGAILLIGGLGLLYLTDDTANPFSDMYLMPYVLLVGITIAAPNAYLIFKGKFHLFHPLCFAAWSYFIPAFFVGGLLLASNLSQPFYLTFVQDEKYNLPLTLFYIALGYGGLSLGFFLPGIKKAGVQISRRLPVWEWEADRLLLPGLLLLAIGWLNNILAFAMGVLGYQKLAEIGKYDGLVFLLTLFWTQGSFILWLCIFRTKKFDFTHYFVIAVLISTALVKAAFQGNRGSLVAFCFMVAAAFVFAVEKVRFKHKVIGAVTVFFALIIGMIYGTTFRAIKQSEARTGDDAYIGTMFVTFDKLSNQDLTQNLGEGLAAIVERFEAVSSLAVVVSNYEKLAPYEESYGLKDNIWNDSAYFFIPRPLWKDKPVGSSPKEYSDLYFDYGENSFIITPMGDLLRNFGPYGIFIGMLILGTGLNLIYQTLIENQPFSFWRTNLYYSMLAAVTYEGFYGTIFPNMIRFGAIAMVGVFVIKFIYKQAGNTKRR